MDGFHDDDQEQSDDGERWVQPESPVLTTAAKPLVFQEQGRFPSVVAYVPNAEAQHIFWDVDFLHDAFKEKSASESTTSNTTSNFLANFKQLAVQFRMTGQLHLRGPFPRCGVGNCHIILSVFIIGIIWLI